MAHKKGVGSTDNGRDSNSKRLGVKIFGGQFAKAGNIIIRQRGTKFHVGENCYIGRDHTIHAKVDGTVVFTRKKSNRTYVSILTEGAEVKAAPVKSKKAAAPKAAPAPAPEAAVEEAPAVQEEAPKAAPAKAKGGDDLTKIEGVGPKVKEVLTEAGLGTFAAVAAASADQIREILVNANSRYKMFDPTTWPEQAKLADAGEWDKLKAWQDELDGGK